jgi:hypothetical protein
MEMKMKILVFVMLFGFLQLTAWGQEVPDISGLDGALIITDEYVPREIIGKKNYLLKEVHFHRLDNTLSKVEITYKDNVKFEEIFSIKENNVWRLDFKLLYYFNKDGSLDYTVREA